MSMNETIYGIWNTTVGGNSFSLTPGLSFGNYPSSESPAMAFDGNITTKYTTFGFCTINNNTVNCGINTGFYFTPKRGSSLIVSLQFYAANDIPSRDPMTVTLEGSNSANSSLIYGSSWTLIYSGPSGLAIDPGRYGAGQIQNFSNTVRYTSYRLLVTSIRSASSAVQYSEVRLQAY